MATELMSRVIKKAEMEIYFKTWINMCWAEDKLCRRMSIANQEFFFRFSPSTIKFRFSSWLRIHLHCNYFASIFRKKACYYVWYDWFLQRISKNWTMHDFQKISTMLQNFLPRSDCWYFSASNLLLWKFLWALILCLFFFFLSTTYIEI